jgi:inositol-hexakisphosphate 5-kinase
MLQDLHNLAAIVATLHGFRFYGCSLLFIYDGEETVQTQYLSTSPGSQPGTIGEAEDYSEHRHLPSRSEGYDEEPGAPVRRSRSADAHRTREGGRPDRDLRRKRGEVNIRIVDFAHTTTGHDFLPPLPNEDQSELGKGYSAVTDPKTGLPHARFPPKHSSNPDLGFLFGLKNICGALHRGWKAEAGRRDEAIRHGDCSAGPLPSFEVTENAHIFEKIFPQDFEVGYLST